ncbi:uncharacterized protein LOC100892957 [Strongylocentrotus purpuratus]|uniref:Uncharacterized protein n=1 Tax=Strongylocentrotus purpuratus TaxID=7668 RepID=A0A7M7N057_STRPU|nr:uncharacterized protein LOC100892957 [Strongylocentrotus purpuratus]
MKISKSEDGLTYFIKSEGFSYGDFNKAAKVDVWRLVKHFEFSRAMIVRLSLRRDFQIDSGLSFFLSYQTLEISPDFYDRADVSFPWCMKIKISYVGKTSFWFNAATCCQKTGKILAQNFCQAVRVSLASRRPIELPAKGADKYIASTSKNPPQRFTFPQITPRREQSFTYTTKALPSDTDSNIHVNQSVCFRYCHDGASLAALQGNIFSKFSQDFAYYNVKTFSVEYVGEMNAGDDIDVQCWEDDKNQCVLYFIISVRDKVACRCQGEWYTNPDGDILSMKGKLNICLNANL